MLYEEFVIKGGTLGSQSLRKQLPKEDHLLHPLYDDKGEVVGTEVYNLHRSGSRFVLECVEEVPVNVPEKPTVPVDAPPVGEPVEPPAVDQPEPTVTEAPVFSEPVNTHIPEEVLKDASGMKVGETKALLVPADQPLYTGSGYRPNPTIGNEDRPAKPEPNPKEPAKRKPRTPKK
jgi:hypothetical protein